MWAVARNMTFFGGLMIVLKENARKELESYFEGKTKEPIRVYLAAGG